MGRLEVKTEFGGSVMYRKNLCSKCNTGAQAYQLDAREMVCPYLQYKSGKKCIYYKPLKKEKKHIFKSVIKIFRH